MAGELSQEALLDFLCQAGGRVTNASLLGHFQRFLREPGAAGQVQQRREQFKGFVNAVATVQQAAGGPKYVVLRKRYRELLGEEPAQGEAAGGGGAHGAARAHGAFQAQQRPAPTRDHPGSCPGGAGRGGPSLPPADPARQGAEPPPGPARPGDQGGPPEPCAPAALPGASCALSGLQQQQRIQAWVESSRDNCSALPPAPPPPEDAWGRPPPIFRSIRCQLALQDLEGFVEQASPSSQSSDSLPQARGREASPPRGAGKGPRDPGGPQLSNGAPRARRLRSKRRANGQEVEVNGVAPGPRHSFRSKSTPGSSRASSSEDELRDQVQGRRGRRLRRSRKMSRRAVLASPGVDAPITFLHLDFLQRQVCAATEEVLPASHGPPDSRPSLVPLEPREHNWIVMVAAGSWLQVRALFLEDPHLALQRDFISGYTALHWIAKHGATQVLQDLVSGSQKAGIPLDVNVKSSCGYTPLHLAAIHGHQRIMKLLVQKLNSKVHMRDSSGKRPWQYLSSSTSGEVWQLLGAPKGKTIFPTQPLVRHTSPSRKAKSQEVARNISRKTSLAACLKTQHMKWKMAAKYPALREREEYSD
ncbi:ankyrin repeat domain-containing protein SOWAHB [Pelodiscus sinensis]|uniref:ankyrin repeat domain-containing protein SOWAHB n=1 Tax=Pelodiscus sinensis TaxID=13735 RepID=UPI003F6A5623